MESKLKLEGLVRATFMTYEMIWKHCKEYQQAEGLYERLIIDVKLYKSLDLCWEDKYFERFKEYYDNRKLTY